MKLTKKQMSVLVDCMVACHVAQAMVPDLEDTKTALQELAAAKLVKKVKCINDAAAPGEERELTGYRITRAGKDAIAA